MYQPSSMTIYSQPKRLAQLSPFPMGRPPARRNAFPLIGDASLYRSSEKSRRSHRRPSRSLARPQGGLFHWMENLQALKRLSQEVDDVSIFRTLCGLFAGCACCSDRNSSAVVPIRWTSRGGAGGRQIRPLLQSASSRNVVARRLATGSQPRRRHGRERRRRLLRNAAC
jgi:hypothetical protein